MGGQTQPRARAPGTREHQRTRRGRCARRWCIERHGTCLLAEYQRKDKNMWQLLESIENSGFAIWLREAPTVLAYATVLAAHALGMAILVGLSAMIALRILGFAPSLPLAPLEKFFPLMWVGFWVNALSGLVLLSLTPVAFLTNPTFYIKMLGITGAIVSMQFFRTSVFGHSATLDT